MNRSFIDDNKLDISNNLALEGKIKLYFNNRCNYKLSKL